MSSRRTRSNRRARMLLAVLARELERRRAAPTSSAARAGEGGSSSRDQTAASAQHPRELRNASIQIRHVVEHPRGDRDVELTILERQVLNVGDARIDTALACEGDHVRRQVDRNDIGTGVARDPLGELTPAAADLENRAGVATGCDRLDQPTRASSAVSAPVNAAARRRARSSAYSPATSAGSSSRVKSARRSASPGCPCPERAHRARR